MYNGWHTCGSVALSQDHEKLDFDLIASRIIHLVSMKGNIFVAQIIERVHETFDYKVLYKKA